MAGCPGEMHEGRQNAFARRPLPAATLVPLRRGLRVITGSPHTATPTRILTLSSVHTRELRTDDTRPNSIRAGALVALHVVNCSGKCLPPARQHVDTRRTSTCSARDGLENHDRGLRLSHTSIVRRWSVRCLVTAAQTRIESSLESLAGLLSDPPLLFCPLHPPLLFHIFSSTALFPDFWVRVPSLRAFAAA